MVLTPDWARAVHHDGSEVYISNPYPTLGETVTISLRVPSAAPLTGVYCRVLEDGEFRHPAMTRKQVSDAFHIWSLEWPILQPRTEYSFKLLTAEGSFYVSTQGVSRADHPVFHDFLILADYQAPHWVREAVFYQIFPDRFHNGDPANDVQPGEWMREGAPTTRMAWGDIPQVWEKARSVDFAGGDLQGITQKLAYIQSLGANALYLTPIFRAASNHRYDASSFNEIDPHVGGDEGLAELRRALDERDMKLVLDITPNHVGITHDWYTDAVADLNAPSAEYFIYNEQHRTFETWLGVASLIKLNYNSQKLRDEMYRKRDSALRRWLAEPYRIDGWRLDVANMVGNLREAQLDHEVWADMRPYIKHDNPQAYLLGEFFQDGTPHTQGAELDAAMNYQGWNTPTRRWLGGADLGISDGKAWGDPVPMPTEAVVEQYRRFMGAVPYVIALQQFNQLCSHDTTRILHVAQGDKALVKLGIALLMAYPGVPCLYYGDEIGMEGGKDPDNRRTMPWDEADWDHDLLAYTRQWTALRGQQHALQHGGYQLLHGQGDTIAFLRHSQQQKLVFIGHRGTTLTVSVYVGSGGFSEGATLTDVLSGTVYTIQDGSISVELAHGAAVLLTG